MAHNFYLFIDTITLTARSESPVYQNIKVELSNSISNMKIII